MTCSLTITALPPPWPRAVLEHGHERGQAQPGPRGGPEPGGARGGLLGRRREHRGRGLGRDAGARGGRRRCGRGGVGGVWGVSGRGRRRRRGGRGGDVHDELHAAAAVSGDTADEVVLARGLQCDGGGAGAVAAERVAGGAGGVVRRGHLVHRVRPAGVVEHESIVDFKLLAGGPGGVIGAGRPAGRIADGVLCRRRRRGAAHEEQRGQGH
uniref:Uncharacterized protein n=1 Tax=Arundo donax TaxID=35708 RepID=A0A0A9EV79_ARUDO